MAAIESGWIGVDLDGTLAVYDGWKGPEHIGEPVPLMLGRVKAWLAQGVTVKIFTARIAFDGDGVIEGIIRQWCKEWIGTELPVTFSKDYGMIELWDDRCVQIIPNTGMRADGK
jgi:hypothetical protein